MPVYLSNGVIGLRSEAVPVLGGVTTVNGYADEEPGSGVEAQMPIPYVLAGDVTVEGVPMSAIPPSTLLREQRYDFASGELHCALGFTARDVQVDINVRTTCNRAFPTIAMQEMTVRVDRDCRLELSVGVDPSTAPGTAYLVELGAGVRPSPAHGVLGWRSPGGMSTCGIAYEAMLSGADGCEPEFQNTLSGRLATVYTIAAQPGHPYRLRQLAAVVTNTFHGQPHMHARRMLADASKRGFDKLLAENADRWTELWRGRIELTGAPTRWQAMADAAYFYLHSSVHRSSPANTSPFGMAYWPDYHYYRGHVMWDIETFAVPPLLLTAPDAARKLLSYRHSRLAAARTNAEAQGYAGAQFPWESAPVSGEEATPIGGDAPTAEHHVSMDVALAFAQLVHATGEHDFARNAAWPVLSEVARWIASRVRRSPRGYEFCRVIGIAETETPVDNNAFVNMSAVRTLREAAALASALDLPGDGVWTDIADGLLLPHGPDGTIVSHDAFDPGEPKGATPEAAAGIFPLGYTLDPETEQRTLTATVEAVDDYMGDPMLGALVGVYAARIGERQRALELYERGFADYVLQPHSMTTEYSPVVYPDRPRPAPFIANLAGFLTGCLYGLTGMAPSSDDPRDWCQKPVMMPEGWDGVHVERLWVRGREAELTAVHGKEHASLDFS